MNRDKLFATIVTAVVILFISSIIIFIFRANSSDVKHFVSKEGEAIAVSLASPIQKRDTTHITPKKIIHQKEQKVEKRVIKPNKKHIVKDKSKPKSKLKHTHKNKIKKHIVKKAKRVVKPKVVKKVIPKKVENRKLFSSLNQKDALNKNSISKKKGEGRGEINRYLATIEKRLRGWPAQRNFAGEEIDVWLKIYPNGKFEYKIKKSSQNSDFNKALISYLDDLKRFGFEPHKGRRAYEIEVKFIAHN